MSPVGNRWGGRGRTGSAAATCRASTGFWEGEAKALFQIGEGGAWGRIRTTDTRIFNPLLYQLSYPGAPRRGRPSIEGPLPCPASRTVQGVGAGCRPRSSSSSSTGNGVAAAWTSAARRIRRRSDASRTGDRPASCGLAANRARAGVRCQAWPTGFKGFPRAGNIGLDIDPRPQSVQPGTGSALRTRRPPRATQTAVTPGVMGGLGLHGARQLAGQGLHRQAGRPDRRRISATGVVRHGRVRAAGSPGNGRRGRRRPAPGMSGHRTAVRPPPTRASPSWPRPVRSKTTSPPRPLSRSSRAA